MKCAFLLPDNNTKLPEFNTFKPRKRQYLPLYWSVKGIVGTIVNLAAGQTTLLVPLRKLFFFIEKNNFLNYSICFYKCNYSNSSFLFWKLFVLYSIECVCNINNKNYKTFSFAAIFEFLCLKICRIFNLCLPAVILYNVLSQFILSK